MPKETKNFPTLAVLGVYTGRVLTAPQAVTDAIEAAEQFVAQPEPAAEPA